MEKKTEKKVIDATKMEKFLDKLKKLPETSMDLESNDSSSKREKFFQKILEDIGPQ